VKQHAINTNFIMLKVKSRARNVTLMTTAYFQKLGKETAHKTLSATPTSKSNLQSSLIQGGLANNPNVGIQQKQDIFGYRFDNTDNDNNNIEYNAILISIY
jgi:hypothetical protein